MNECWSAEREKAYECKHKHMPEKSDVPNWYCKQLQGKHAVNRFLIIILVAWACAGFAVEPNPTLQKELPYAEQVSAWHTRLEARYDAGLPLSSYELAVLGLGYAQASDDTRLAKAERLLRRPAEEGYAISQDHLAGVLSQRGKYKEAFKWALASANQGYLFAALRLSNAYDTGQGVSKDRFQACMWLLVIREQVDAEEINACKQALSDMQYQEALRMAREVRLKNGQFKAFPQNIRADGVKEGTGVIYTP